MFRLADGGRFTAKECSDFNLFCTWLQNGPAAAEDIVGERSEIGFNMARVFLAYWDTNTGGAIPGIGKLNPADWPGMYEQLEPFCKMLARYRMYAELVAFTGPDIPGHWLDIGHGLKHGGVTNAIVELVNENNQHNPRINTSKYSPLPGIVCSRGSNGSQNAPERDPIVAPKLAGASGWWYYETFHTNDANEWWRKVGHNAMEFSAGDPEGFIPPSRMPILSNENTRPDRDGNINHFHDAAKASALLNAGACFHSQSGKASVRFDARDRDFAHAWVIGMDSVNLEYQHGRYYREAPGPYLRVYSRIHDNGSRETAEIRV